MNIDYRLKFALFLILAAIVFFMFKANNIFENKIVTHQSKSITFKDDTKPIQIGSTYETTYTIKKGDTLCVIEAMKLFNEIESDISGTIIKVLVDDMSPVEYDQPLIRSRSYRDFRRWI